MIWPFLTVISYSITAFGDKYIAAKLKCNPAEYTFIVSAATVLWLLFLLPFTGWDFQTGSKSFILLVFLVVWKLMELYTTSVLLKFMEPYELKVWLGINVVLSYLYNVYNGKNALRADMLILAAFLLFGIYIIVKDSSTGKKNLLKTIPVCIFYIFSKLMYGVHMREATGYGNSVTILIIVLSVTSVIQLPKLDIKKLVSKKGFLAACTTRIPNATGLLTEALAATANLYFYALIQPVQLLVLFIAGLVKGSGMSPKKRTGSIICIISVCIMTILCA